MPEKRSRKNQELADAAARGNIADDLAETSVPNQPGLAKPNIETMVYGAVIALFAIVIVAIFSLGGMVQGLWGSHQASYEQLSNEVQQQTDTINDMKLEVDQLNQRLATSSPTPSPTP